MGATATGTRGMGKLKTETINRRCYIAQSFKEVSAQRINQKKYAENYDKIFGKKENMTTRTDFSDDPRYQNARYCEIHEDISFAIDDECPQCEEDSSNEEIVIYQDHIEALNKRIDFLNKRIKEIGFKG